MLEEVFISDSNIYYNDKKQIMKIYANFTPDWMVVGTKL